MFLYIKWKWFWNQEKRLASLHQPQPPTDRRERGRESGELAAQGQDTQAGEAERASNISPDVLAGLAVGASCKEMMICITTTTTTYYY